MSYMSKAKIYINEEKKTMSYVVYTQKPQFNLNSLFEFVYIVVFYFGYICLVYYNRSCNKMLFIWNNY